jgi:fructose-bisphosphate aldolase, class I
VSAASTAFDRVLDVTTILDTFPAQITESMTMSTHAQELQATAKALVSQGKGILAMDESNSTCQKRFEAVGIAPTVTNRQDYRELILTTPSLNKYISSAILFDETIHQTSSTGESFVSIMQREGIIIGIKVDAGTKPLGL